MPTDKMLMSIAVRTGLTGVCATLLTACPGDIPDQSQFVPLEELRVEEPAVVRLYAAPIPGLRFIAIHPWFVVKRAGAADFDRWEVWQRDDLIADQRFGFVYRNLNGLESDVGAGGTYIIAELTGPAADAVVEFIYAESPTYSARDCYSFFPGPNSNTYAQWVLDQTQWDITLTGRAVGKDVPPECDGAKTAPNAKEPLWVVSYD